MPSNYPVPLGTPGLPPLGPYAQLDEGAPFYDPLDSHLGRGLTLMQSFRRMMDARAAAPNLTTTTKRSDDMGYYRAGGDGLVLPDFTGGASSNVVPYRAASSAVDTSSWSGTSTMQGVHERRRPRMHVTNVRALRRAMRRVTGFARVARKVMTFTSHHKLKGRRKGRR